MIGEEAKEEYIKNSNIEGHCSVTFWLNRVAEEEINTGLALIKEASTKNWQAINFKSMPKEVQLSILKQLKEHMKKLGWQSSLENSKEELKEEQT